MSKFGFGGLQGRESDNDSDDAVLIDFDNGFKRKIQNVFNYIIIFMILGGVFKK